MARPIRYDLMRKAAQPYLDEDETIQAIFRATTAGRYGRAALAPIRLLAIAAICGTSLLVHSFAVLLVIAPSCVVVAYALAFYIMRYRYFVITSRRILVLTATFWDSKARGIRTELPRSTRLGPPSGPWHVIRAGNENLSVNEKYFDDIAVADDPTRVPPNAVVRRRCVSCGQWIGPDEPSRAFSGMELAHNVCPSESRAVAHDSRGISAHFNAQPKVAGREPAERLSSEANRTVGIRDVLKEPEAHV